MKKMSFANRILLFLTGFLAGFQIVKGMEGFDVWPTFYFTAAFGVLLLTCMLLILFGFEILESSFVVFVAAILPLSLSLGLVAQYWTGMHINYLVFTISGLCLIFITRYFAARRFATMTLAVFHGSAGLLICFLPLLLSLQGVTSYSFLFVSVGGGIIGIVGILFVLLQIGRPLLSQAKINAIFPGILFITTVFFVIGMCAR